jgi:hypothetical protein
MREPPAVNEFLHELDQALSGGRRWHEEVMTEIHAHLLDAVDAAGGAPEDVQRIVERLGDPRAIAQGLNEVDAHSRRLRRLALAVGSSMAIALGAVAVFTTRSIQMDRGVSSAPAPSALIGKVVAATPVASEIRLRSRRGVATYSLHSVR